MDRFDEVCNWTAIVKGAITRRAFEQMEEGRFQDGFDMLDLSFGMANIPLIVRSMNANDTTSLLVHDVRNDDAATRHAEHRKQKA